MQARKWKRLTTACEWKTQVKNWPTSKWKFGSCAKPWCVLHFVPDLIETFYTLTEVWPTATSYYIVHDCGSRACACILTVNFCETADATCVRFNGREHINHSSFCFMCLAFKPRSNRYINKTSQHNNYIEIWLSRLDTIGTGPMAVNDVTKINEILHWWRSRLQIQIANFARPNSRHTKKTKGAHTNEIWRRNLDCLQLIFFPRFVSFRMNYSKNFDRVQFTRRHLSKWHFPSFSFLLFYNYYFLGTPTIAINICIYQKNEQASAHEKLKN